MRMVLRNAALLLIFFVGIGLAIDLGDLREEGCDNSTGVLRCHLPGQITDVQGRFIGDIACFSTVVNSIDKGCFSAVELQESVKVEDCTYSVNENRETVFNACDSVTLNKGKEVFIMIDLSDAVVFGCEDFVEGGIYGKQCFANGRDITFDGLVDMTDPDVTSILITKMTPSFDLLSFILNNLIYITLIIVILVVAYLVFRPRRPVLKERKPETKKAGTGPKELTKRERRYGRKI